MHTLLFCLLQFSLCQQLALEAPETLLPPQKYQFGIVEDISKVPAADLLLFQNANPGIPFDTEELQHYNATALRYYNAANERYGRLGHWDT